MSVFTEDTFENALIQLCETELGYEHIYGPDIDRDYSEVLLEKQLFGCLQAINPDVPETALNDAIFEFKHNLKGDLVQRNEQFMNYLRNGVDVSAKENDEIKNYSVQLIDYADADKNQFCVVNQFAIHELENKRPDVVVFVNGFPLVVMELKTCTSSQTDTSAAYLQLKKYMKVIPTLFNYNAFCIISDLITTKAGTITSPESRFMAWKTIDGDKYLDTPDFSVLIKGMLEKRRFLDIIKNFIAFQKEEKGDIKILAAYHQYHAVHKALLTTMAAVGKSRKGGVFWHTQGSGKSLSMVFLAHLLRESMSTPTIVVITDRNDLDGQLFGQFAKCSEFLRTTPMQAKSIEDLTTKLSSAFYGNIYFTTMQKFEETGQAFSTRDDIIVLADEAHRSQYGLGERFDQKHKRIVKGAARLIREALPNATFVGFTGTPIDKKDKSTIEVFGDTIDVYDMTQSVMDGATRPVYYENRVMKLNLDPEILKKIDAVFEAAHKEAEEDNYEEAVDQEQKRNATLEGILKQPSTIDTLAKDIITHYESRQDILTGKAMIVAFSRPIAIALYRRMLELRPLWKEKVKCVMTSGNQDPEDWHDIIGTDKDKKELEKKFKDNDDPMKIAIVVDMWLTGFDVPSLATMYVFKPMSGHNLMQAIARVNRVFQDKEGGLVVDYVGIAGALKEAMKEYTNRDRNQYGDMDIAATAYVKFRDSLETCKDFFNGFDISPFFSSDSYKQAQTITHGLDFILGNDEDTRKLYLDAAYILRQASSLCRTMQLHDERYYATYFETIRVSLIRLQSQGRTKKKLQELSDQVSALLQQGVHSDGIVNLFDGIKTEFSLMDPAFMKEVEAMKEKNLASELLRKLLQDKIHQYKRTNVVKSQQFSEKMEEILNRWRNALISNAEVIEELLKLAKLIKEDEDNSSGLGLTNEEKAFYDALTRPQAVKDFYENDQLVSLTKELTDALRKNRTIDWNMKEAARAEMRSMVRRLLKKYKYPPEGAEEAMKTVLEQCELWTDNNEEYDY